MDGVVREVNVRVLGKGLDLLSANGGMFEINQLLFAVETALVADSEEKLCRLVSEFGRVWERIKLRMNVGKIIPQRHRESNKNPAVIRGSAARQCIRVLMCDQITACKPHWHIRSRWSTIKRVHRFTPELIKHTKDCHGSTMSNVTLKHTSS